MKPFLAIICCALLVGCKADIQADAIHYDPVKFHQDITVAFTTEGSISTTSLEYHLLQELKESQAFRGVYLFNSHSFNEKNDILLAIRYTQNQEMKNKDLSGTANALVTLGTLGAVPTSLNVTHELTIQLLKDHKKLERYEYRIAEEASTRFLGGINKSDPKAVAKYFVSKLIEDLKKNESFSSGT